MDDERAGGRVLPIWGVFIKQPGEYDDGLGAQMIYMSFSEEVAEAKRDYHALVNNNFKSQYVVRRVDQQEYDEDGRILYGGSDNNEGL